MRFLIFLFLLFVSLNVNAKKVKGYFVSHDQDTTHVTFKVPYRLAGINLIKISDSLLYYSEDGEMLYSLYPKDVVFVKIFNKDRDDYDILPFNGVFVQRLIEGRISYYKSEYMGMYQTGSVLFPETKGRTSVYYLELKNGERRYVDASQYMVVSWYDYLHKDYLEFVECLNWDKKKRKEMRNAGEVCNLKGMALENVILLFNKTYK